jgi:ABC-type sugar transport system ATPase subunit
VQVVAHHITRVFGSTRALDDVSIALEPGLIHALVGENGAGKSTLLKILAGAERADAGEVLLDNVPFAPRSLREAAARGVGLVFQEITINPALSVAENVYLGQLRRYRRSGLLNTRRMERDAQRILDGLSAGISVSRPLGSLDLGQWKCIEIARALAFEPSVLFLDESTAFLNHREVDAVLSAMEALKRRNLAIAFVSHHLAEVERVADRLTILKDGRKMGDFHRSEISREEIQARMVGRALSEVRAPKAQAATAPEPVLTLDAVSSTPRLAPLSLALRRGEVIGIAGLKGAGGERLMELVAGIVQPNAGQMALGGTPYRARTPAEAWRRGIAYLPGDRTAEGLILDASVMDNLVMARPPRRGPLFDRRRARRSATHLIDRLRIKTSSRDARSGSLSGGNLQKVVLGKCLAVNPSVLLLHNPTRGVDIGARLEIYRILREEAAAGLAVLVLSEDLNELISLSDRILVMRGGAVASVIERPASAAEDDIIRHMT